ncbi:MAG TPA: pseudouridine synthase [Dehalococcoidia bacterium]|jgi:23S rRNA pseudouridine2605 synthase|nr:pseudouridine synthase [Dehalococcoidia bacterium]MDP7261433.1 pseudouridine synthase [Dehalococcoidia bacterium]MDP7484765.1 pseudouridine synthase [Dehalococcoidia bacterium]HJP27299.1 pseudouridine synthase [Dehalococcoidia bacterium]|tara:strand:- start:2846 stop:3784 length:939 start_codon:yes stop_codon:yes gene_type:complete
MKQRLHKILASAGIASLRKSEQMISEGRVKVNGETAHIGDSADLETDDIVADGNQVAAEQKRYLLLNKPTGYVTTVTDPHDRPTVMDLIDVRERIYPVGRLDVDTEGLLFLTNDGDFSQKMAHPSFEIEKTYLAELATALTEEGESLLVRGIRLEDGPTAPAKIKIVSRRRRRVEITIHDGRNRIVRRMFESVGSPVTRLRRIRFGTVGLDDMPKRGVRELTGREMTSLMDLAVESRRVAKPRPTRRKPEEPTRKERRADFGAKRPVRRSGAGERAALFDPGNSRRPTAKTKRRGSGRRTGGRRSASRSGGC